MRSLGESLKPHLVDGAKPYYRYDKAHEPDCWFDAVKVWEVKAADFSLSPKHFAALGLVSDLNGWPFYGLGVRF